MNISGEITVPAPRAAVFDKLKDAPFFASCIDGVKDLKEIDATHYDAVLETKVAYMKFSFKVSVEITKLSPPDTIEAKVEGTPIGVVGRLTATSRTHLSESNGQTVVELLDQFDARRQARQHRPAGAQIQGQGHGKEIHRTLARRVRGERRRNDAFRVARARLAQGGARPARCRTIRRSGPSAAAPP